MRADPYSRLVAALKIVLPLIALGILSTLFLLSRNVDPNASIPFAEGEIAERIRDQQVTGPFFSGATTTGDRIAIAATRMGTGPDGGSEAQELAAQIEFLAGGNVAMIADRGNFDLPGDTAVLRGNVLIESSTGYRIKSDTLTSRLSVLEVTVPGPVNATGPAGTLQAGHVRIAADQGDGPVHLLFTDGVKLVYDPGNREE